MTDVGMVRRNNEDNWCLAEELSLALVADGMGGEACGEVASQITVDAIRGYLREPAEELAPEHSIKEAIRLANRLVRERARQAQECGGMGSTVVAAFWTLPRVVIANVGDSRAYLWRGGALRQLSYDQNLGNDLRHVLGLTEEQISQHPHRNLLTMAIGVADEVLVCTSEVEVQPGDEILLCSDGLYGPVAEAALRGELSLDASPKDKVERLVGRAMQAGAPDNVTALLVRYRG